MQDYLLLTPMQTISLAINTWVVKCDCGNETGCCWHESS